MTVLHAAVELSLASILSDLGLEAVPARLVACPDPAMGDAAVQAALAGARILKRAPLAIAADIAEALSGHSMLSSVQVVQPGYVNLRFSDAAIADAVAAQAADPGCGILPVPAPERIVIDFGGPNVGKSLHVGHLRSFVIGESLRRILGAVGHRVVSDIHLGDWGLPAGMIVAEIELRGLAGPWLAAATGAGYPDRAPISEEDLLTLYPTAAAACRDDPERMAGARAMAARLQVGEPGPTALWRSVVGMAKEPVRRACARLDAHFDLFLGESDVQGDVPALLERLEASGTARRDGGALIVEVARVGDRKPLPPLVVARDDGSSLYATTDLATAALRVREQDVQRIVYVVDERQSLHFEQVARAAAKGGIAPGVAFEHVGFGTVNGADGRPFRTRDGATMRLDDLLDLARDKALAAVSGRVAVDPEGTAEAVGIAALRFADLSAHRSTGYALDLDRAISFEGRTGPYVLYGLVRLRSLLAKVGREGGPVRFTHPAERALGLSALRLDGAVHRSEAARSPHELVGYAFEIAGALARFYVECPIATESDGPVRDSRVSLCLATEAALSKVLELLACRVPAAM